MRWTSFLVLAATTSGLVSAAGGHGKNSTRTHTRSASKHRGSTASSAVPSIPTQELIVTDPSDEDSTATAPAVVSTRTQEPSVTDPADEDSTVTVTSSTVAPVPSQELPVTDPTSNGWFQPSCGSTFLYSINEDSVPVSNVRSSSGFAINADIYGVDLFITTAETIQGYHDAGKKVVCYFSAGSFEDGRPDGDDIDPACYCNKGSSCAMDGWPEWWLDLHTPSCVDNVHIVMAERINTAKDKKCDAVDPDNVDSYNNNVGWGTTESDQLAYLLFLSKTAHDAKLGITLKNAGDMVSAHTEEIVAAFDMSVIEQCAEYNECDTYKPFVDAGKAAFQIEYESGISCTMPGFSLAAYNQNSLSYKYITDMCSLQCGVSSRSLPSSTVSKAPAETGAATKLSMGESTFAIAMLAALAVVAV